MIPKTKEIHNKSSETNRIWRLGHLMIHPWLWNSLIYKVVLMILICILPLLNHKTYTQKVNYSTNTRILREHQTKKMVWSLPATRKRLDCTTQVSHLWLCEMSVPTSSATHPAQGAFIAKTFPHWPQTVREIKVAFPRELIDLGQKTFIKQTVFHKVTSLLLLTHCTNIKFNSARKGFSVHTDWSDTYLSHILQPQLISGKAKST